MKQTIAIIGGGPSAIMFAATLDENKFDVTIYEQKASIGRKFLVAGDGGLNITHSEPLEWLKNDTPLLLFLKKFFPLFPIQIYSIGLMILAFKLL